MTSIADIAKKAGVAKSTVSRVLNQHPYVSDQVREKVLAVMTELDYSPNQVARDLSQGQTHKIGVVIPHTCHPYFNQLIGGLLDTAKVSDYQLVMMPSDYDQSKELGYLEQLRTRAIDGLIFTSRAISLETIASYSKYGRIVLCEELKEQDWDLASAYLDRGSAFQATFVYLKEQSIKSPLLLFSRNSPESATYQTALAAFRQVYGRGANPRTFGQVHNFEAGYDLVSQLLQAGSVEAILATSDDVAAGLRQSYLERGETCPLLVGQENQLSGRLLGLPTIDHQSYHLGELAFSQVLAREVSQKCLVSEFIER